MKILTTGKGSAGSWQCRGVQLGGKVGDVKPRAKLKDMLPYDVIVAVKRLDTETLKAIKQSGKPWIWDLVDFYPQPQCSKWSKKQAISWVRSKIEAANPDGIIYPNQRMREDVGIDGTVIYHHARENAEINPIRKEVKVVGYDGCEKFLSGWRTTLDAECKRRGWEFKVNIPLDQMDIAVAVRGGGYGGYVQNHWKSNVKLANAHATGTPFVGLPEAGYMETSTGYECFVANEKQLSSALDYLTGWHARRTIHNAFINNAFTLDMMADGLRSYVEKILRG